MKTSGENKGLSWSTTSCSRFDFSDHGENNFKGAGTVKMSLVALVEHALILFIHSMKNINKLIFAICINLQDNFKT